MPDTILQRVRVIPGSGQSTVDCATVVIDDSGIVTDVAPVSETPQLVLLPFAVDLHLDNLVERRNPRATVQTDQTSTIASLDAECAAAGIGVVCIAARCENAPRKGIVLGDAVELAEIIEAIAPHLACDWRLHARVEVTDDGAVDTLSKVLEKSTRVALISVMEHSIERSRFSSAEEHRRFYAQDWGVSLDEVDSILAEAQRGATQADHRRREVAAIAASRNIPLASHDDRGPTDIDDAFALGARIAEFPLTLAAAQRAQELGMTTVLGAPNAIRGRSTSEGNLLVSDALKADACDVLCSDYLPSALLDAPIALAAQGVVDVGTGVDLVAAHPASAIGVTKPTIEIGQPLNATLRQPIGDRHTSIALWRNGQMTFQRRSTKALTNSLHA